MLTEDVKQVEKREENSALRLEKGDERAPGYLLWPQICQSCFCFRATPKEEHYILISKLSSQVMNRKTPQLSWKFMSDKTPSSFSQSQILFCYCMSIMYPEGRHAAAGCVHCLLSKNNKKSSPHPNYLTNTKTNCTAGSKLGKYDGHKLKSKQWIPEKKTYIFIPQDGPVFPVLLCCCCGWVYQYFLANKANMQPVL